MIEIYIIVIWISIFVLLALYKSYRLFLEHIFREHDKWKANEIPPGILRVAAVEISDNGKIFMRLIHEYGLCDFYIEPNDTLETIRKQIYDLIQRINTKTNYKVKVLQFENTYFRFLPAA